MASSISTAIYAAAYPAQIHSDVIDGTYVGTTIKDPRLLIFADRNRNFTNVNGNAIGDLNGDGVAELLDPRYGRMQIVDGRQRSIVLVKTERATGYRELRSAGDVDADGDEELIVMFGSRAKYVEGRPNLSLIVDSFEDLPDLPVKSCAWNMCFATGVGDVDADGFADIAIVENGGDAAIIYGGPGGLGVGQSIQTLPAASKTLIKGFEFTEDTPASLTQSKLRISKVGDMNGDGGADILLRMASNQFHVVFSTPGFRRETIDAMQLNGRNGFVWYTHGKHPTRNIYAGDLNHDGLTDLLDSNGTTHSIIFGHQHQPGPMSPVNVQQRTAATSTDIFWSAPDETSEVVGYRISTDSGYIENYNSQRRTATIPNVPSGLVKLQTVNADGLLSPPVTLKMKNGVNAIPSLSAAVYGPNLIELFLDSSLPYSAESPYMIWRNGEALATSSGNSFIDGIVKPNTEYRYVITHGEYRSPEVTVSTDAANGNHTTLLQPNVHATVYPPRPPIRLSRDADRLPRLN